MLASHCLVWDCNLVKQVKWSFCKLIEFTHVHSHQFREVVLRRTSGLKRRAMLEHQSTTLSCEKSSMNMALVLPSVFIAFRVMKEFGVIDDAMLRYAR